MLTLRAPARRAALSALAVAALVGGIVTVPAMSQLLPVESAAAAGTPDVQLTRSVSATTVYGRDVAVELVASSPDRTPDQDGFNLTFSDIIPPGASVTSSSLPVSSQIVQPDGSTLVIWTNVADLLDGTEVSLSYTFDYPVIGEAGARDVGDEFTGTAHAYVHTDPYLVPNPLASPADGSVWEDVTGSAEATSTTRLAPFRVDKRELTNTEGELLRGIHDNKAVYEIRITNNTVAPTTDVSVTDHLPAELEFLGCAPADDSPAPEYPGAPALGASFPSFTSCDASYTATMVQTDPDGSGPLADAVYTRVHWDLADLAPGAVVTLRYAAAIPLHANTLDAGGAVADLANNTGAEAADEQSIVNHVAVSGDYAGGAPVATTYVVDARATVTAEDVLAVKTRSNGEINHGQTTTWTIDLRTSEYVESTEPIVVTDTIPDGLDWAGSPFPLTSGPTENPDGTLTVSWTVPPMGTQDTAQLTYQTTTRLDYRATGDPVVARDSWTNRVDLVTGTTVRSGADGSAARDIAGVVDRSQAGQSAGAVTGDKLIGAPVGGDCTSVTTWSDDSASAFHPGDTVCFRIDVDFPDLLKTVGAQISDYLPAGFTLVGDPHYNTPLHDVGDSSSLEFEINPARTVMSWTKDQFDVGSYFSVILTTRIGTAPAQQKADIAGNLLKVRYLNTGRATFQLRDQADAAITAPLLTLDKTLVSPASGTAEAGQPIEYRITVTNTGAQDASATEVRDVLPTGWSCAEVTSTTPAATSCASGTVAWTGLTVPAGGSVELTVLAVAPTTAAPGDSYTNRAGVRSYQGASNGGAHTYYPASNIDPAVTPNTDRADDTAVVNVTGGTITKTASSLAESGNNSASQATIGEVVTFTITATVPSGTTLYGTPAITDAVNARYSIVGTPTFTLDTDGTGGAAPSAPQNATVTGSTVTVPLASLDGGSPTTYVNPASSGADVVVLTIQARVVDASTNRRATNTAIPNSATMTWQSSAGTARSVSASANVTVVEPNLSLTKTSAGDTAGVVTAGGIVTYTITVGNSGTRSSMAHGTVVVDTVPQDLIPLAAGDVPVADGGTVGSGGVWDAAARTLTFPAISTIAVNGTSTLSYRAQVANPTVVGGPIVNAVRATTSSMAGTATGERDSSSANGGSGSGYVVTASRTLNATTFTLGKSATPATRTAGEVVHYTLTLGVPAGVFGNDVTIIDTLPAGVRLLDDDLVVTCVQSGGACSPVIDAELIGAPTSADAVLGFFLGDFGAATAVRTVTIEFDGVVTTSAATGTQTNSARVYSNDVDTLGTPATVPAAGSFTRPGPTATANTTVQRPQLTVDKKVNGVDATRAKPGQVLHYSIAIRNTGTSPAYDITVTDTPDPRLTGYTAVAMPGATANDTDPSDGTLSWTLAGPIAPGATVTLAYDLTVPSLLTEVDEITGAEVVNRADVPSYFGVPAADRTLPASSYLEYDDVPADRADVELDLASIGDRVWLDVDGDGVQDAGEPGIAGAAVTVLYAGADATFGTADDESVEVSTDAAGEYVVHALPGGTYRVTVGSASLPAGLTPSYDLDGTSSAHRWQGTLAEGGAPRNVDFGYTGTGAIGDRVWFDQDADGVQDAGEPGIAGATVTVVWAGFDGVLGNSDDISYATTTSATGAYSVTRLPRGLYDVAVSGLPAGYGATYDLDGDGDSTAEVSLSAGQTFGDADFGYAGTGSVGDLVWIDRDEDGEFDAAGATPEQGVAGATVRLDWHGVTGGTTDPVVATFTTTTDADGAYLFQNLVPGAYTVRVTGGLPLNAVNTHDRDSRPGDSRTAFALGDGEALRDADFGYDSDSALGERVWWDRDGDGVQDAGEPGFEGVDVTVVWFGADGVAGGGDDRTFTTTTGSDGYWSITDLPEGAYRVTVDAGDLPTGLAPTYDADGTATAHTSQTTLGAGAVLTQNFGYRGPYSLGDLVFLDRDADGVQDAGEPGLAGVTVRLDWGGFTVTAVTGATGAYSFPGLAAGDYTVSVVTGSLPSSSLTAVSDLEGDPDDASADVTVAASRTDADFGFRGAAALGDTIWHDRDADGVLDPAESGISGVTVTATWAGRDAIAGTADDVELSTTTDADGAYGFDHLPAGSWVVTVDASTLPGGFTEPTAEEDTTLDGSTTVALAAADAHTTADFGYRGTGSIGDRVWLDLDADGVQDAGEPGVRGQQLEVVWAGRDGDVDGVGDETWTVTTGADGVWTLGGLPDGRFRVRVLDGIADLATQTGDRDAAMDGETLVDLAPGSRLVDDADFGYAGDYELGDTVWWDEDRDGVVDAAELGIPGVTVEVRWFGLDGTSGTADDVVRTDVTDAAGAYLLEHVPGGRFLVSLAGGVPAGFAPVADPDALGATADGRSELELPDATAATQYLDQDFGLAASGAIGDRIWLDLDADGSDDAGEPGIAEADVELTWAGFDGALGTGDDVTWTTRADAAGAYGFAGLPAGDYRVDVAGLPAGVQPTADPDGIATARTAALTLAVGASDEDQDFGFAGTASVGDEVWIDVDGDGARGPLEPGLPGVAVTVRHAGADGTLGTADDLVAGSTTDASGVYGATSLPDGAVEVSYDPATLPAGYIASFDRDGGDAWSTGLTLALSDAIDDVDFALAGDAQLHGVVFEDLDGDGRRDRGEPGVPGTAVVIEWTGPSGPVVITVITDRSGSWGFDALPPGAYRAELDSTTVPAGYRVVTERVANVALPVGGTGFVVMGISDAALALTGHDPRTNLFLGLVALLFGIGVLLIVRARRVRELRS